MEDKMKKVKKYLAYTLMLLTAGVLMSSCEKFLNPPQELNITKDKLYEDWYEYRSIEMGMYGLQQQLVEQLFILGELRADLVQVTENANADMVDIQNFSVSRSNQYASPTNLFKLISASNNFIQALQNEHPEVLDPESPVTNYDRLYGEALCMRAWAYFTGVRIYGKMPYIHESLATYEEIDAFVNSPGSYVDSVYISYSRDGYYNDTVYNQPVELEKQFMDEDMVIDYYTDQLENEVKAVGVNHYMENDDISWEITIWSEWSMNALLGHMYLTRGDLSKAAWYFEEIIYNSTENLRYQLDNAFAYGNWGNIFTGIDGREHIYTIWFNKANFQQNQFQNFFEAWAPHSYMIKPTYRAIYNWESQWRSQNMIEDRNDPSKSEWRFKGIPSDFYRGIGSSYLYARNGVAITEDEYFDMIFLRSEGDDRNSKTIMEGMDTIVFKYSLGKSVYDQDANYILYRAAGIQLYLSEIYLYWATLKDNGLVTTDSPVSVSILNDGSNYSVRDDREQLGVRGRIGLGGGQDKIEILNIDYIKDPYTNEILGYRDLSGNFLAKQNLYESRLIDERARELAFEGERFYDLMRVAKRRDDPSFLASAVSAKFPASRRDEIYNLLMDENNWYINYFDEE